MGAPWRRSRRPFRRRRGRGRGRITEAENSREFGPAIPLILGELGESRFGKDLPQALERPVTRLLHGRRSHYQKAGDLRVAVVEAVGQVQDAELVRGEAAERRGDVFAPDLVRERLAGERPVLAVAVRPKLLIQVTHYFRRECTVPIRHLLLDEPVESVSDAGVGIGGAPGCGECLHVWADLDGDAACGTALDRLAIIEVADLRGTVELELTEDLPEARADAWFILKMLPEDGLDFVSVRDRFTARLERRP